MTGSGSAPRPAATVLLIRDGPRGPEVLLTLRPRSLRFMGGAAVFPGGAVAPSDSDPRWASASARSPSAAAAALGIDDAGSALAAFVCAIREAFEEVGFFAAPESAPVPARNADLLEHCLDHGISLATDALTPAGRWVTPDGSPVRFDTFFFTAPAPSGWRPVPDPSEVDRALWDTPDDALAAVADGQLIMAPPTIRLLQQIRGAPNAAALVNRLRSAPIGAPGSDPRQPTEILSQRLSPLVHVVLAPNPGIMTGPGTNTYVVGRDPAIVLDPAVDDDAFLDEVCKVAGEIGVIAITHRHPDHTGGAAALASRTGAPVRAFGDERIGEISPEALAEGDAIDAGNTRLIALHTPGHASDHLCFLMEEALFSGDTVLGEGTAVIAPPDGDMKAYLQTLERLAGMNLERIYPAHFRVRSDTASLIEGYIDHRKARERAILDALAQGPATIEEIVARVYTDTPPSLHPIAVYSALAHLEMAAEDGRVLKQADRWELES